MRQIGGEFGYETNANALNAAGDVLVASRNLSNERRFQFIAADGTATTVSLPGLVTTMELSMNDHRAIAGYRLITPANDAPSGWDSFVWLDGTEFPLAALDPARGAQALAINNNGRVVGSSRTGSTSYAATFWAGDLVWNLNSLLSAEDASLWELEEAVALSDKSWIAGNGWYTAPGTTERQQRGFTLTLSSDFLTGLPPSFGGGGDGERTVPVPGTPALTVAALVALALPGGRRRARCRPDSAD